MTILKVPEVPLMNNQPIFNQQPESLQYSSGEETLILKDKQLPIMQLTYWQQRYQFYRVMQQMIQGWRTEVLVQSARNNTQIVISQARKIDPIVRTPFMYLNDYKQAKEGRVQPILIAFQTGRLGFIKNQKKTFTAADTAIKCLLWIIRKYQKILKPILVRFRSRSVLPLRHKRTFDRHFEDFYATNVVYGIEENIPVQTGFFRILRTPRKRLTYRPKQIKNLLNQRL